MAGGEKCECATADAGMRQLALRLSRAQDDERKRIAADLHDEVGQDLVALQLGLSQLSSAVSDPDSTALVDQMSDTLDRAIRAVRSMTFELHTPVMPELGIEGELEQLAISLTKRYGIPCTFEDHSDTTAVSPPVAVAVLRVCREVLHNIARHAHAQNAELNVSNTADCLLVGVRDDGIGIRAAQRQTEAQGFGLLIARERLAEVGGKLLIAPDDFGTEILVMAPLLGRDDRV